MPIYEYQCDGCSYRFELKQSIKDDPISTCERCGKTVRRLISSPGIMFKGSGWYVTDYSDKLKPPSSISGNETGAAKTEEKKESATSAPATATSSAPASTPAASAGSSPTTSNTTPSSSSQ